MAILTFHSWRKNRTYWVLFVLVLQYCAGETQRGELIGELIGAPGPITALAGDDVILPCSLSTSVRPDILEWSKPALKPKYVYIYNLHREGHDLYDQNPSYKYRTALFKEELKNGNLSLKLSRVTLEDEGNYTCFIPSLNSKVKTTFIRLIVVAVSQPVISILGLRDGGVVLQCESEGWYPVPQLRWMESNGRIFSAEVIELPRDGRYTVRSNMTVKKADTNRFICRVQLPSHSREAEMQVPGDLFKIEAPDCVGWITGFTALTVFSIMGGIYVIFQQKTGSKKNQKKSDWEREKINMLDRLSKLQSDIQERDKTIQTLSKVSKTQPQPSKPSATAKKQRGFREGLNEAGVEDQTSDTDLLMPRTSLASSFPSGPEKTFRVRSVTMPTPRLANRFSPLSDMKQ